MRLVVKIMLLVCLCVLARFQAQAQESRRVLVLHPVVGPVIDAEEKARYRLFPFHQNIHFDSARFLQLPDSSIILETRLKDGRLVETRFSPYDYQQARRQIDPSARPDIQQQVATVTGADTEKAVMVEMRDGTILYGKLLRSTITELEIETTNIGKVVVQTENVKSVKEAVLSKSKKQEYWFPNPHATRLLFAPTAYQLRRGEGYLLSTYVFFLSSSVGVTDNFTIGGGLSLFPGLELQDQLFFVNPKIGFKASEKINLAAGLIYLNVISTGFGIAYGVSSFGNTDRNFTAGLGYGFFDGEVAESPVVMLGGMLRPSRKIGLLTENYFVVSSGNNGSTEFHPVLSLGIRFMGPNLSADLAFWTLAEAADIGFLPFVSFAYKF